MGQSALSQSDNVIRRKSLSERLTVETPAEPEAMAERFAPCAREPSTASLAGPLSSRRGSRISFPSHRAASIARFSWPP